MLEGRVALITGGTSEIGISCIKKLASNKCDIILHYHTKESEAFSLKKEIEEKYDVSCFLVKCDLEQEIEINQMIIKIKNNFNHIDILVNNAAICIDSIYDQKTKKEFMKTLEVNLVGTFLISKNICDIMYEQKYGKVVNITSTNGIDKYYPICLEYDASKAGLISLTHNLSLQYAPYLNVNAIAPGWVKTQKEIEDLDEGYIKLEEEKIFLNRFARPEEIASLVYFLVSDDASYINNEVIRIDGGTYHG